MLPSPDGTGAGATVTINGPLRLGPGLPANHAASRVNRLQPAQYAKPAKLPIGVRRLGFAPNGREPRLLVPRQSWRAVVMPHLLEAGRGDVIAPSIQIEEASVAIVGKALLVIPSG